MHLFQSEWLREPTHPVAGSYAKPAYGMRYARTVPPVDIAIDPPEPPRPVTDEARASALPPFDRAA